MLIDRQRIPRPIDLHERETSPIRTALERPLADRDTQRQLENPAATGESSTAADDELYDDLDEDAEARPLPEEQTMLLARGAGSPEHRPEGPPPAKPAGGDEGA